MHPWLLTKIHKIDLYLTLSSICEKCVCAYVNMRACAHERMCLYAYARMCICAYVHMCICVSTDERTKERTDGRMDG